MKRDQIRTLLEGIETGDPEAVAVVNEVRYIQHNPQTHEGSEGLAALFQRLSKTSPKVNIVRRKIGFEIFRFEDGRAVEHWDNIQERQGPNKSGRSMVDGPTEAVDLELTESNRTLVRSFVESVLIDGNLDRLTDFVDEKAYAEHNPRLGDGIALLRSALEAEDNGFRRIDYQRIHRILAEGSFVLCVSEGSYSGEHSAFYDLFRLANGKIVEHWDTTEKIAPRNMWKNDNGKF